MNKIGLSLALLSASVLVGCSSAPDKYDIAKDQLKAEELKNNAAQEAAESLLASVPNWVLNPPKSDDTGVYAVGMGDSKRLDVAMKKANLNAQFELAKSFGQELSGNERSYVKDGNAGELNDFTQLIDSIVAQVPINGYEVVESEAVVIDGKFNYYTLMRLSYEQFGKGMSAAQKASANEFINAEFSDLYQRLEAMKVKQ